MHLKTVAKYIRRSPYQAIAAVLIMTLTFFVISIFSLLTIFSIRIIQYFESRPQLTIFFNDQATSEEVNSLKQKFQATGKTVSINFVSKKDALKIYREQNKNDPILLDLVTEDVLPSSLEIQATRAEYLSDLAKIVKDSNIVSEVVFQKDIIDTLISWISAFRKVGIGIISVLLTVSFFIIITIIGIKITIRRQEIEIMKLIGATNWFIRMPFLLEGILYGFVGALIGWGISYMVLLYFTPSIESYLKGIPIFPISFILILEILAFEVVVAVFLGVFASFLAVLRYLK